MSTSTDSSAAFSHHFDTLEQSQESQRLGIWMFLITEVMFFGGIFVAYTAYRIWYPKEFEAGSSKLNVLIAGINSLLLLASSLTITLAIHAAHEGKQDALKRFLLITIALAVAFLGLKSTNTISITKNIWFQANTLQARNLRKRVQTRSRCNCFSCSTTA